MKRTLSLALFVVLVASLAVAGGAPTFEVKSRITLGGEGGWDYLTADSANHRVFISRGTHVMVVDVPSGKVIGDIPNTPGVHGIALVPELGRGFISSGGNNTVTVFDLKDYKPIQEVKVGERPDAIVYDPTSGRVFTFNAKSQDATAVDAKTMTVAGTVALGGKPEFSQPDGKGSMIVNIEDTGELVKFDATALTINWRSKLTDCEEPSGLAFDAKHRRTFSVCGNKKMMVADADSGKVVATVPIDAGPDAAAFDPEWKLAFSSNGSGSLTVVSQQSADKYEVIQTLATPPRARTMALDMKTHYVYSVTAQFDPAPAATPENPRPRGKMKPGTFELIVVGPK